MVKRRNFSTHLLSTAFAWCLLGFCLSSPTFGAQYDLPPPDQDVIGEMQEIEAEEADTFVDLARRYGVGYTELRRANPDVDPWLPGAGTRIVIPTQFVLPDAPRRGVVLNLAEYRMYFYPQDDRDIVYTFPISIGRMDWETPLGRTRVVAKAVRPSWYPPKSIREEHAAEGDPLPAVVPPGPDNPLGEYAIRLGLPGYLIHGTNRPAGVGMRVTHGCIRMFPEDIESLFPMVPVKTPVRIVNQPVKMGWSADQLVMEAHEPLAVAVSDTVDEPTADSEAAEPVETVAIEEGGLTSMMRVYVAATRELEATTDWALMEEVLEQARGVPVLVGQLNPSADLDEVMEPAVSGPGSDAQKAAGK
ncbi:MAG: L,D-transpeptidase family protein [Pseudomonadota bacterium]